MMRKEYRKKIGLFMSLVLMTGQLCVPVSASEISPVTEEALIEQWAEQESPSVPEEEGQTDSESMTQTDPLAATESEAEQDPLAATETEAEQVLQSVTQTEGQTDAQPAAQNEGQTDPQSETEAEGQTESQSAAENEGQSGSQSAAEPGTEQDAQSAPEQDGQAGSQSTPEGTEVSPAAAEEQAREDEAAEKEKEEIFLETALNLALAGDSDQSTASLFTRGVYWVAPQVIPEGMLDITDTFFYDDSLLTGDSLAYNQQLATMSFEMAVASISSEREEKTEEGYAKKSRNLEAYLEDNGFIDFETNDYYKEKMTIDSMGAACAHKKIDDNGKEYTLLVIVPRSAGYEAEWGGNFMMGGSGDHEGFSNSKDIVLDFAKSYVAEHAIEGDIKVWTVGYSRGGGVTNQVGAALLRDPQGALGEQVTLSPENLYCYTFGTPKSAGTDGDYEDSIFDYVHNTFELYDIVTSVPPSELGFDRYGTETGFASPDRKERMLELLRMTNEAVYNTYMNGGDPDGFTPKTLDLEKLLYDHELVLVNDENSYLPGTQAEFLKVFEGSVADAVKTRENYYENYQMPLVNLAGYFFSHDSQWSALIGGIKESDYAVPAAVSMYISLLSEKYFKAKTDETLTEIGNAINTMDQLLADLQSEGVVIDEELLENYGKLKEYVQNKAMENQQNSITETAAALSAFLYSKMVADGLTAAQADEETIATLTSEKDSKAMSRIFTYLLLDDDRQDETTSLIKLQQQMAKHAATFIGNAGSYLIPHYNEVIRSWLRTLDPRYDDFTKETAAQTAGYRRVYVEQPEGTDVTGTVLDSQGNVVAVFKNGQLISSSNDWIRITTSDNGNWLRLPVDDTYRIEFEISDDTVLNIKVTEYSVYDNEEVRTATSDSKYDWKEINLRTRDDATLVVSALDETDGKYTMGSLAAYYLALLRRYSVTYVLDGGMLNGTSGDISQYYDDGTGISLPEPTREGYRFAYWEGSRYNAGDVFMVTADHIFKAIWEKISVAEAPSEPVNVQPETAAKEAPAKEPAAATAQSSTVSKKTTGKAAPLTGDETPTDIYLMLLVLSGLTGMFLIRSRKQKKDSAA